VRMDEEEKRLAKIKAIRDTKVKRSSQPMAAPVHAPAAAADAAAETPVAAAVAADAPSETAASAV
jgi:small subunit ribosomal protein S6